MIGNAALRKEESRSRTANSVSPHLHLKHLVSILDPKSPDNRQAIAAK
jgi:hypothetical protein